MIHRKLASALFAGVLGAGLMGCSDSGSDKADDQGSSSSSPASDSSSGSQSGSSESPVPVSQQAEEIGLDPAHLPKPIATEKVTVSAAKKRTIVITLYKMEKRGRVMLAYFSATPNSVEEDSSLYKAFDSNQPTPRFVDLDNLKVYKAATSGIDTYGSDFSYIEAKAGKPSFFWFAYPQFQTQAKNVYVQFSNNSTLKHKVPLP